MSIAGHIFTGVLTSAITLTGVKYFFDDYSKKFDAGVERLNQRIIDSTSSVAKAHQLDEIAALVIDKKCSQPELEFDPNKATVAGLSINSDISVIIEKMPCLNGAQRADLMNAKLLDRQEFGVFVTPPSGYEVSPFPSFAFSARKTKDGTIRREIAIIGTSSGGIQGMGYEWDYTVSTYDRLYKEPEFTSKAQFKTKEKAGTIYHTRLYKRDYGCLAVAFHGNDKELEKQQARRITMVNQPCKDITSSFLDNPGIQLSSSERFALRSYRW